MGIDIYVLVRFDGKKPFQSFGKIISSKLERSRDPVEGVPPLFEFKIDISKGLVSHGTTFLALEGDDGCIFKKAVFRGLNVTPLERNYHVGIIPCMTK
jgi:hypothetical protein